MVLTFPVVVLTSLYRRAECNIIARVGCCEFARLSASCRHCFIYLIVASFRNLLVACSACVCKDTVDW